MQRSPPWLQGRSRKDQRTPSQSIDIDIWNGRMAAESYIYTQQIKIQIILAQKRVTESSQVGMCIVKSCTCRLGKQSWAVEARDRLSRHDPSSLRTKSPHLSWRSGLYGLLEGRWHLPMDNRSFSDFFRLPLSSNSLLERTLKDLLSGHRNLLHHLLAL